MGKLLEILGVKEQQGLDKDIFVAEELIIGMQEIYKTAPEGYKKEKLANTIAELVRLMMQQVKGLPLEKPTEKPIQPQETDLNIEVGCCYTYTDTETNKKEGFYIEAYTENVNSYTIITTKSAGGTRRWVSSQRRLKELLQNNGTKVKMIKGNWYKGTILTSSETTIDYLYKLQDVNIDTDYIMTDCEVLFWAGAYNSVYSSDKFSNNEAFIFSVPATTEEVENAFIDEVKRRYSTFFENGRLRDGLVLQNLDTKETFKVSGKTDVRVYPPEGLGESPIVWFVKEDQDFQVYRNYKWAVIGFGSDDNTERVFKENVWYIVGGKNILFQSTGVSQREQRSDGTYYYEDFYKIKIDNRSNNAMWQMNDFIANSEWRNASREATEAEIEAFLLRSCELLGFKEGTIVNNTNIGETDTNSVIPNNYNVHFYIQLSNYRAHVSFNGIDIFDSAFGFADIVGTQRPTPTPTRRRGSKPQPDTNPMSVAEGTIEVGNDGNRYVARKGADGILQWRKLRG